MVLQQPRQWPVARFLMGLLWTSRLIVTSVASRLYPGPATPSVVDVPDLTTITSSEGQKYIVRQLEPRIVYPEVDMANCASLTVRDTLAVENHTFFEGHSLDTALPKGGAVLVNDFSSDITRDPNYSVSYLPLEDADGDEFSTLRMY